MTDLTILVACSECPKLVAESIKQNYSIFSKHPLMIVNKKGGELFKVFNPVYFEQDTSFWFARRFGLEFVKTEYVLCLDVDTILPPQYIESAIQILETIPEVGATALDYANPYNQKHLAFGTSIWRTDLLKKLYDWRLTSDQQFKICECKYMWEKAEKNGFKIHTFPIEAIHLKSGNIIK